VFRRIGMCLCVVLCVVFCVCASAGTAFGSSTCWPLASGGPIVLPFDAPYAATGGDVWTHRGVDIQAEPGDEVRACVTGAVVFAGRVPAGEGASTIAVTIQQDDGSRLTCMPLEEVCVSEGERVEPGAAIGLLATNGDPSSESPHLHVSHRVGSRYTDPMGVLVPPASALPESEPSTVRQPAESEAARSAHTGSARESSEGEPGMSAELAPHASSSLPRAGQSSISQARAVAPVRVRTTAAESFDAARRYEARATDVMGSQSRHQRFSVVGDTSVPWTIVLATALPFAVRFGRKSLLSSRRPGESEVAAAVGR